MKTLSFSFVASDEVGMLVEQYVKFLNNDKRYSKNSDYLFVSQQNVERSLLEGNISISGQKGKVTKGMVFQFG